MSMSNNFSEGQHAWEEYSCFRRQATGAVLRMIELTIKAPEASKGLHTPVGLPGSGNQPRRDSQ